MKPPKNGVIAIYPGSFDPITSGHLDVIERGSRLFGRLIVSILGNQSKSPLFSIAERIEMLRAVTAPYGNVEIDSFDGLLADYALKKDARVILRGIRAISDYEYELQMALMNRRLQPQLETVFLLSAEHHSFISSRLVKEVIALGGNIAGLVPPLNLLVPVLGTAAMVHVLNEGQGRWKAPSDLRKNADNRSRPVVRDTPA